VDRGWIKVALPRPPWLAGPRYLATESITTAFIRSSKVRPPRLSLMALHPPFARAAKDGAPGRYKFRQATARAAGCCIRPGSPAMADQEQTRPHNGRKHRSFSRTKTRDQDFACGPSALPLRGITSRVTSFTDARKAAQIVKERWFLLPGQPQPFNIKHTVTILL